MEVIKTKLEGKPKELLATVSNTMEVMQSEVDALYEEYSAKKAEIEAIKSKIKPIKEKMSELDELRAGLANRKSRVKYFPQFATKYFDDSKDAEFIKFVEGKL